MTPEDAMERLNVILAHAWMVRTFLKHSEEIQNERQIILEAATQFPQA